MKDLFSHALYAFDKIVDNQFFNVENSADWLRSFWMGGYECSDQLNCFGNRVDLLAETRHLENIDTDYQLLRSFDIYTVREGIRWSAVERKPYTYDFSAVEMMIVAGKKAGIQQIWDICHFGYPDDLTPLHPAFTDRFVALCTAFIQFYRAQIPSGKVFITPINEVGFIAWLGGEVGGTSPYAVRMGWEVKYALTKAYIKAIKALKAIDSEVMILATEPLMNIVPPLDASAEELLAAQEQHGIQYQVMDMLTGAMCPELGGRAGLVDIIGFNYYYNNQWIAGTTQFLPWTNDEPDPRWRSLSSLLLEAEERFHLPMVIAETSHPKEDRPIWITYIAKTCKDALAAGVNLLGICLYPVIDRPDWDDLTNWHQSGLWDADPTRPDSRELCIPYAKALLRAQHIISLQLATQGVADPARNLNSGIGLRI